MAYLFKRERIHQSLRLGLFGAWKHSQPSLHSQLEVLHRSCPLLLGGFSLFGEEGFLDLDENRRQQDETVRLFGSTAGLHELAALGIKIPTDHLMGSYEMNFMEQLQQAYRDDNLLGDIELSDLCQVKIFPTVRFQDR
jgi:hypothetical protein